MDDYITGIIVGLVMGIISTSLICKVTYYEKGQIDCINGAIYYKLDKQMDGSTGWVYSKEIVK